MTNGLALNPGTRIGPYEIVGLLGLGGMGEVYRARDTKLNRDVAIKVLLAAVANDAERLARFSREAQLIAAINHPNIAQIYGLEDAGDVRSLVMELVEGSTLAERIGREAIPVEEALPIARQIAEALEAAHDVGIIHRDLKPANIKVRTDGTVKVLDFGLAKAVESAGVTSGEAANSPTLSMQATAAGVILGTAAYMAPEQARGKAVDKRADVWAFGCVLFEMLTGTRAFRGEDVTDTIVAVVSKEPDWRALPAAAAAVRPLLVRCLKKDRKQRLQAIGDARIRIEELLSGTSEDTVTVSVARSFRAAPVITAAVAAAALAALATWAMTRPAPAASLLPARLEVLPSPSQSLAIHGSDRDIAISPDGRYIAYRAGAGVAQLVVRAIDRLDAQPLPGITNARQPFFSPDGRWIGYFDGASLKKVATGGGPPITVSEIQGVPRGASWGEDDQIVFATTETSIGLQRVSASGGDPIVLTRPDTANGETNHWYPSVLPGGRGVLFTLTAPGLAERAQVAVLDLKTGRHKTLIRGSQAEYVGSGYLLFASAGALQAVRFDLEQLEALGNPEPVVDDLWIAAGGAANYSVSRQPGTLVYIPARALRPRSLVWVDRSGRETAIPAPPRAYFEPRLSPDGTRVALSIRDQENDIWIWDFTRPERALTRLTFDADLDQRPVWTADGARIVFASQRERAFNLYAQNADGSGTVERLTNGPYAQAPAFVTPDGTGILGSEQPPGTAGDIVWFPLKRPASRSAGVAPNSRSTVEPLVRTPAIEYNPALSPDGHYIAYQSNESGPNEIYVRPYPQVSNGRWQVSTSGGTRPVWAPGGGELFYLDPSNTLTAVPVQTSSSTFTHGNPARVFGTTYAVPLDNSRPFDVAPDGRRFLMIKENAEEGLSATRHGIVVVLNWFEELKAKVSPR